MRKINKIALSVGTALTSLQLTVGSAMAQLSGTDIEVPQGFAGSFGGLINGVISFVMIIAAILVFLYLIWGGIEWITSGGDKGKTESARNKITAAVIGLIVVAASYAILTLALNFLGFTDLNDVFNQSKDISGNRI